MINLVPTAKIIDIIKKVSPDTILVGFKLEASQDRKGLIDSAHRLMERSGAEIIVANDFTNIKEDSYKATLVERGTRDGEVALTDVEGRRETATLLCNRVERLLERKG